MSIDKNLISDDIEEINTQEKKLMKEGNTIAEEDKNFKFFLLNLNIFNYFLNFKGLYDFFEVYNSNLIEDLQKIRENTSDLNPKEYSKVLQDILNFNENGCFCNHLVYLGPSGNP